VKASPNVTRWAPLVVQSLREAGIPEKDLAQWTAAGLALIQYESRGNPEAQHGGTGAYGLTQQIAKWHPQHRGNPLEHLRHWGRSMAKYYKGNTAGSIPSTLLMWGSGPGAVRALVESGETVHNKVILHLRNIEDMTSGATWRAYSSWLHGWTAAGSPTTPTRAGGKNYDLARSGITPGSPLASPWTGRIVWRGKSRTVGKAGPGGVTGLQLGSKLPAFLPLLGLGALLLALFTWWGAGKG